MAITPFDIMVVGISIILFLLLVVFVSFREGLFGIKTPKQVCLFYAAIVFIPVIAFYTHSITTFEPLEKQVYERYFGKFDKILQVSGSSKYPLVTVKTNTYALHEMESRYFMNVQAGDKIYFRVEAEGNVISSYYIVGGRRYGVGSCYYPMSCWERKISKYEFYEGSKNDISPYIRRP